MLELFLPVFPPCWTHRSPALLGRLFPEQRIRRSHRCRRPATPTLGQCQKLSRETFFMHFFLPVQFRVWRNRTPGGSCRALSLYLIPANCNIEHAPKEFPDRGPAQCRAGRQFCRGPAPDTTMTEAAIAVLEL